MEPSSPQPVSRVRRLLRYARVAFSLGCGMVCVLFVVLWVRSYWAKDFKTVFTPKYSYDFSSHEGRMLVVQRRRVFVSTELYLAYPKDLKPALTERTKFGIGRYSNDYFTGVSLAYWILAPITAAIAALPWQRWIRWRFSLRTLLIVTTLIAAVLGVVVLASR